MIATAGGCADIIMLRSVSHSMTRMHITPYMQECFNSPYGVKHFPEYAEPIPGQTTEALSSVAKECKVYLIGGNIWGVECVCGGGGEGEG